MYKKDEVMAALLMEATKKAGALDAPARAGFMNLEVLTPLHFASRYTMVSTVEKLVTLGANAALLDEVRSYHTRVHSCT